ncbi:hypothetical protein CPB84DRAFT_1791621 [Gymnopilus junonius]|uniref:Uncharacterized protein n=1 Tax=Gymnopilus junonius TaxID=109634 RepID=A0A9P5NCD4_GYMJU|nr:hypothetical protein CPB84DRAFT_1791621 [Gymnopilus junonius]
MGAHIILCLAPCHPGFPWDPNRRRTCSRYRGWVYTLDSTFRKIWLRFRFSFTARSASLVRGGSAKFCLETI